MQLGLAGKSVLITGASKGIGLAAARGFAAEGCHLHLAARNRAALDAARIEIEAAHGGGVVLHVADLGRPGAMQNLAASVGDVDILVNNAGDIPAGPLEALDIAEVAPLDVQTAKADANLTVVSVPSLGYGALNVNLAGSSPLADGFSTAGAAAATGASGSTGGSTSPGSFGRPSCANGKPKASSSANASASLLALVVIVMSRPRTWATAS